MNNHNSYAPQTQPFPNKIPNNLGTKASRRRPERTASFSARIVALPVRKKDERGADYVTRMWRWSSERLARGQQQGWFRAMPFVSGLTNTLEGLFYRLSVHSWSEGLGKYAPIAISERSIAALMGYRGCFANGKARKAIDALLEAGAIEIVKPSRGNLPTLVRILGHRHSEEAPRAELLCL